jgi:hypothetical protein
VKSFHGVLLPRGKKINKIGFHYFLGNWRVQKEADGPFAHPDLNRHTTAKSKQLNTMTTRCKKNMQYDSVTRKSV